MVFGSHHPIFSSAQSSSAQLSSAQLRRAQLSSAQLSSVQLSSAQLSSAHLSSAKLNLARFFRFCTAHKMRPFINDFNCAQAGFWFFATTAPFWDFCWSQLIFTRRDRKAILPRDQSQFLHTIIHDSLTFRKAYMQPPFPRGRRNGVSQLRYFDCRNRCTCKGWIYIGL